MNHGIGNEFSFLIDEQELEFNGSLPLAKAPVGDEVILSGNIARIAQLEKTNPLGYCRLGFAPARGQSPKLGNDSG